MQHELNKQIALVTGAGQGIGKEISDTLLNNGASVAMADINLERVQDAARQLDSGGERAFPIYMDVSRDKEVVSGIKAVIDRFGRIDILVNNTGVSDYVLFAESSKEQWDRIISICLYGVLNCCHAVINHMIEQRQGRIINIVSDAGRVGEPRLSNYSAAKGGIIAFPKALAKEVGPTNITVNCVSPGATLTETTLASYERMRETLGDEAFKRRQEKVLKNYPLRRLGKSEDIAPMVAFLASEQASYITAQVISVNGGYAS